MSKRRKAPCRNPPMRGHTVCRMHGGKTPVGFALPQTRTGKYSRILPVRLAQRYEEARRAPGLLSLKDDVAMAEVRLGELFARLDAPAGDEAALWQEIRTLWEVRARLVQTEARTLLAAQQMVTIEQLNVYFGVITEIIQRAVLAHADTQSARRILTEISQHFDWLATHEEAEA